MNGLFSSWFASLFHDILMADEDCFLKRNDIFTERGRFILRIAIVDDVSEERTTLSKRLKYQFEIRNIQADLLRRLCIICSTDLRRTATEKQTA